MPPINVITISQQYGSDGYKVAAKLAGRLRWLLTDDEIAMQVAYQLEMTEEEAVVYDERAFSFVDRLLISLRFSAAAAVEVWPCQGMAPISTRKQERLYREELRQVMEEIASAGKQVIVGHGAQVLLANRPGVLHVRIVAPLAQRVRYVMQQEQLSEAAANAYIRQKDRQFAQYLQVWYHRNVDDTLLYDLVINSHGLELESQADLICLALERKARWLALA